MVIHQRQPITKFARASSIPETRNQMMLTRKDTAPPPYTISFPNGKKETDASLKHCSPIGIPMIVMHQRQPARIHPSPLRIPPNRNQSIFPIKRILENLLFYNDILQKAFYHVPSVSQYRIQRAGRFLPPCVESLFGIML